MKYNYFEDIATITEFLNMSQLDLAQALSIDRTTLFRIQTGKVTPSKSFLEKFYDYAFRKNIPLNKLKEMFWLDCMQEDEKLLFHGAKEEIVGGIDVKYGKVHHDFGQAFYAGESFEQSVSFVNNFKNSSIYILSFKDDGLSHKTFGVNQDWMFTIAYYRHILQEYEEHPYLKKLIADCEKSDYIIAPIADNRMYDIISQFAEGSITDEQCKHALAATNLGMQYVFKSEKSVSNIKILERCYVSQAEREHYSTIRLQNSSLQESKAKMARIQYKGKGKYIDELLK